LNQNVLKVDTVI